MIKLTFSNVSTSVILILSAGIWVGGMNAQVSFNKQLSSINENVLAMSNRQIIIEQQMLVWFDDAEIARANNHYEAMEHIKALHEYNKRNDPGYDEPNIRKSPYIRRTKDK